MPEQKQSSLFSLLGSYAGIIGLLVALTLLSNGLSLVVPKLIASAIDTFTSTRTVGTTILWEFLLAAMGIFIFTYLQNIAQTYA